MRITEDSTYRNLIRDLARIQERMQTSQNEISSGLKVAKPSDDPSAAADIVHIHAESGEAGQYLRNLDFGRTRLEFTDGVLDGVERMVERVRTLGQLSLTNLDTASLYVTEVTGLRDQILAAANTGYQGRFIFGGSNTAVPPYQRQADGSITYQGNSDAVSLQVGRASKLQIQIPGNEVFTGAVDVFATVKRLNDAMTAGDKAGVNEEILNLERVAQQLSVSRSRIGGNVNVADSIEADLKAYELARASDLTRLQSADLSKAISDFTLNENALRAATAVGARISQLSILDYL
jgi:flagellar hook-associated protein 3 FlgL